MDQHIRVGLQVCEGIKYSRKKVVGDEFGGYVRLTCLFVGTHAVFVAEDLHVIGKSLHTCDGRREATSVVFVSV